jgi:subtilisin family serine protease
MFACCSVQEPAPLPEATSDSSKEIYTPGQAVLRLSDEAVGTFNLTDHPEALEALGIHSMERMFPDAGEFEARHRAAGLHRWYKVSYDRNVPSTKAGNELSTLPGVEDVVFLPRKERRGFFNDPRLNEQWHYFNDGSLGSSFKAGSDINVQPVWENYTGGSREVIVAVIDEGVQASHLDLEGVVLTAEEGSRNFVEGYSPTNLLEGDHGTHVSGTIAAINNNGIGVCGIAGGLTGHGGVRVMACNIFSSKSYEDGDDAAALVWAADHGAVIANNSWGYVATSEKIAAQYAEEFNNNESPLRSAIDYFIQYAGTDADGNQTGPMKGGLVLFAAGNEGYKHDAPAEYEPVVAVGAFGPDGKMPRFSNYGEWVDILAPGGSDSYYHSDEWILSTLTKGLYGFESGTSMACPHAAGVAALLVSYFGGPGFTADDLKEALLLGADMDAIDLQGRTVGGGKLDAAGSFSYQDSQSDPDADHIRFSTTYTGDWRLKSHETLEVPVSISGNNKAQLPVSLVTDCPGATADCAFDRAILHINALLAEPGDYTATVKVGSVAKRSYPFTILPNHVPELIQPFEDQIINAASSALTTLSLAHHFSDYDEEELNYEISLSGDNVVRTSVSNGKLTLTPAGYGLATLTVRALDGRKTEASAQFRVLARNVYQDMDIFPNPASDWLNIRPASERTVSVELVNLAGATVYSIDSVTIGPFDPLVIDLRGLPGGTYSLFVGGERFIIAKR